MDSVGKPKILCKQTGNHGFWIVHIESAVWFSFENIHHEIWLGVLRRSIGHVDLAVLGYVKVVKEIEWLLLIGIGKDCNDACRQV